MTHFRTALVVVLLTMVSLLSLHAQSSDTIRIYYSHHGTEYGATHRTLATIEMPKNTPSGKAEIRYDLPGKPGISISSLEVMVTDSISTRDIDDYKGRIVYYTFPLAKSPAVFKVEKGKNIFTIVANLYPKGHLSKPGEDILSFKVKSIRINGKKYALEHIGDETSRRLFDIYRPLYVPGDTGSRNFRIPALLKTQKGTLLAVADRRKYNDADIPEDIDIIIRRSEDGGYTWSEPSIIIAGKGRGKGFGDAALVQTKSGKIIMTFIGGPGLWNSTAEAPQPQYIMTSDDDGLTWSEPRDITPYLYGHQSSHPERSKFLSIFIASGQGIVTEKGRVMFVAAFRPNKEWALDNYVVYSDDEGKTWKVSELACKGGDEAKVIELPDGTILMSVRNPRRGERIFKVSYDQGETWQDTDKYRGLHDPACNGAPLFIPLNGKQVLIHSLPLGPNKRWDGVIYRHDDTTQKWSEATLINPGMSAYSDMILLDDKHIGYFVEEDSKMSLVFIKVPISILK